MPTNPFAELNSSLMALDARDPDTKVKKTPCTGLELPFSQLSWATTCSLRVFPHQSASEQRLFWG